MTAGIKPTIKEIEEIVNSFGYFLLKIYTKNWKTRVIIKDEWGYKYDSVLRNLINTKGKLNFIDKGQPELSLYNISLWIKYENKTFKLTNNNIYLGVDEPLMFYHSDCKEVFYASWHQIYSGGDCAVCSGFQVGKYNNLAYLYPDLAKEWHPDNKLKSEEVTCGSGKKVYWICSVCGYGENKEWFTTTASRTNMKSGCPACAGRVVTNLNRLSIMFPTIAKEWHPTKNGDLTPLDVSYGSHKKVWWLCEQGHEYYSIIKSRTIVNSACPICNESKGEKKIGNFLSNNDIFYISQKKFDDCRNKYPLPFDVGIPYDDDTWKCIEYHGEQHYRIVDFSGNNPNIAKKQFEEIKKRDKIKEKYCKDNNIPLLIIPYWEFDNIEKILTETLL